MFDDMSKSPIVKDIVEEVVAVVGFTAKYLPRKYSTALDPIFGERDDYGEIENTSIDEA